MYLGLKKRVSVVEIIRWNALQRSTLSGLSYGRNLKIQFRNLHIWRMNGNINLNSSISKNSKGTCWANAQKEITTWWSKNLTCSHYCKSLTCSDFSTIYSSRKVTGIVKHNHPHSPKKVLQVTIPIKQQKLGVQNTRYSTLCKLQPTVIYK